MTALPSFCRVAHFCPRCGEQCSCRDAEVSAGAEEEMAVAGCTHRCERQGAPETWARPAGYIGPCPECGSTRCPGYYRPDHSHLLAF